MVEKKEKQKYFDEALSDFVHDVASGRAIRHLVNQGYTTNQIMQRLDFPTPRERVEQTVYRYMVEKQILLESLPLSEEKLQIITFENTDRINLISCLSALLETDGETNSYVSCPFGTIRRDRETRLQQMMACLTTRERDYLMGIPWKMQIMYHRLDTRMWEISTQMALHCDMEMKFLFLKSEKMVHCSRKTRDCRF